MEFARSFKIALSLAGALSLGGCQTAAKYTFSPGAGQETIVRQGRDAVVSKQPHSAVVLAPTSRTSNPNARPEFVAMIQNTGKEPITFRFSEISAANAATHDPLKVYSLDELQTEARTAALVSAILIGTTGAVAGAAAAQNAGRSYGSGTVSGPYGTQTYNWQTYNPGLAQATADAYGAATGAAAGAALAQGDRIVQNLENNVLVDQTLMPGEWYGGFMTLDPVRVEDMATPRKYMIRVKVGPDTHIFMATSTSVRPG